MRIRKLAIIGGWVSGCFLAHLTNCSESIEVTIFEKSRGLGGRCGVRRNSNYGKFKLGAQFFTNKNEHLSDEFERLKHDSLITNYPQKIGFIDTTGHFGPAKPAERFVGHPSMNSFIKAWAKNASLKLQCRVKSISYHNSQWIISDESGNEYSGFDACVLSFPRPQGEGLWQKNSELELPSVRMYPCWTLMMITRVANTPWQSAFVRQGSISWYDSCVVGKDSQKWTVHASPEWSAANISADPQIVKETLIQALSILLKTKLSVSFSDLHLWRYASSSVNPSHSSCLWDLEKQLGYIGDWFCGGRVEGAMTSAWELHKTFQLRS